jgi:PAS domain S-box-containing protein
MHYTGMLAFSLPIPIEYDWPTVLLSLLAGILSSAFALLVVSRRKMGVLRVVAASIFMGAGIVTLHYTAMASMRLSAMCQYSPSLVALSVVLAIVFSLIALWLAFLFRDEPTGRELRKLASAVLMGTAIVTMHYTAMAAATFTRSSAIPDLSHAVSISTLGTVGIAIITLMVLGIAMLTCLVDRLQEQSALLNELFEQAPQAVTLMTEDNRVVRVNREFTRIFGYTAQETLGRRLSDLIVPTAFRNEFEKHAELVAHGKRADAEGVRRRKDGSFLHVLIVHVPVSMPGEEIAVYGIYHDITERKRAEDALRRNERYLAAGQKLSHTGSWALNVSSGELFWSQETFRIFGFDPAKTTASLAETFLQRIHPDDRPRIEQGLKEAPMKTGNYEVDYRIVVPDGSIKHIHDVIYSLTKEAGQVVERYGVVMDVTARRRAEEELQKSRDQLRALTAQLQNVREEERTRVAREIHDELGQALTAIKLDVTALVRELPADQGSAAQRGQSILKLLDETIQSVQRISTDLRPGILDDLGLAAALEWAAEEFETRTGTRCRIHVSEEDITIDPDRATALFRIFQEILTNVARHAKATQVNIRLDKDKGKLVLEVHDNGLGISEEQLQPAVARHPGNARTSRLLGGELIIQGVHGGAQP